MTLHCLLSGYERFQGSFHLHVQGLKVYDFVLPAFEDEGNKIL
jgi:hypothetical protein